MHSEGDCLLPHAMWVSVWQNFSQPLYPGQDPYQSFSPPGIIRRHLFLHIPVGDAGVGVEEADNFIHNANRLPLLSTFASNLEIVKKHELF